MPVTKPGIDLLKQDESHHIASGIFLLSHAIAVGDSLWDVAEMTMNTLLIQAETIINEIFALYDPVPFCLKVDDFVNYALMQ